MKSMVLRLVVLIVHFSSFFVFPGDKVYVTADGVRFRVETVLDKLEIPWSIVFDRNGTLYFTERPGRLRMLRRGETRPTVIATIKEVVHRGEGGLMGLALHPDFERNGYLYLSFTAQAVDGLVNKVVRYTLVNEKLTEPVDIVASLPGASVHNGCRIRFGPDGKLYITTGDAARREIAQDPSSLGGKILRVNDDGTIPADNPFPRSPVFALGFRNPQGIDWHPESSLLYQTEHGPSGFDGPGGGDEVNLVEAGKNYGWPVIHHAMKKPGMVSPLVEYTPAVAPASGMFYRGEVFPAFRNNFFFGGLRGQRIQRLVFDPADPRRIVHQEALLQDEFRRIRDVAQGTDGFIYFSTSNRDGRARPFEADDRIMRLVPAP